METLATTADGTQATLGDGHLKELRDAIRGELIATDHTGYDGARRVWNGNIDRRPAIVVRCAGVADVQQSVNFARSHNLRLSVRGRGHSAPGCRNERRRPGDRSVAAQGDSSRSGRAHGARARRSALARPRSRNTSVRSRQHGRHRIQYRCGRTHDRRRAWLVDGQVRTRHRQSAFSRHRHGRRTVPQSEPKQSS